MDDGSWKPEGVLLQERSQLMFPEPGLYAGAMEPTTPNEFVEEKTTTYNPPESVCAECRAAGGTCDIVRGLCFHVSCDFCANLIPAEANREVFPALAQVQHQPSEGVPVIWRTFADKIPPHDARALERPLGRGFIAYATGVFVAAAIAITYILASHAHGAELADDDATLYGLTPPPAAPAAPVNLLSFLRPVFRQFPAETSPVPLGPVCAHPIATECAEDDHECLRRHDEVSLLTCRYPPGRPEACAGAAEPETCRADCLAAEAQEAERPVDPCTFVLRVAGLTATVSRPGLLRSQDVPARAGWRAGAFVGQCPPPPAPDAVEKEEAAFAVWFGAPSRAGQVRAAQAVAGTGGRP